MIHLDLYGFVDKMKNHLSSKTPMSFIRIGDGQNTLLARGAVIEEKKYNEQPMMNLWPKSTFFVKKDSPEITNYKNRLINAIKESTVVGIFEPNDVRISMPEYTKRPLTDRVLNYYNITLNYVSSCCLCYDLAMSYWFWKALVGKKIAIISEWGNGYIDSLNQCGYTDLLKTNQLFYYGAFGIKDIDVVVDYISKCGADVVLVSATNQGKMLCAEAAKRLNVVTVDMGRSLQMVARKQMWLLTWRLDKPYGTEKHELY